MPRVSFIIPTLKRPEHLRRCLASISKQTVASEEVLVGIRADDEVSPQVLSEFGHLAKLRRVEARGVGVVGSMNSCLSEAGGDFIALVDDDVELPEVWTEILLQHLQMNRHCVAAGGRDLLLDNPEMRRAEPLVEDVGRIHWYGRITGNHHRGGGLARCTDALRGSNMLCRAEFLKRAGFESRLRGKGAQVSWELALALQAHADGKSMFFDPSLHVLHHVAPRHDQDSVHRGVFSKQGTEDMAFNETFVALVHGRTLRAGPILAWQCLVGTPSCPGFLRSVELLTPKRPQLLLRLISTFRGRLRAVSSAFLSRRNNRRHYLAEAVRT